MNLLKKIAALISPKAPAKIPEILYPGLVSEKQFAAFKPDQRMQAVMITGDVGQVQFYEFMKYCVLHDPDLGVRFAALKRLPNFPDLADLTVFLKQLDSAPDKAKLEPYLTMALFKTRVITEEELNLRLNGG
jgi:hypothetical protein